MLIQDFCDILRIAGLELEPHLLPTLASYEKAMRGQVKSL